MDRTRPFALVLAAFASFGCGGAAFGGGARETGMLPARWTAPDGSSQEVPFSFDAVSSETGGMFTTLGKGGEHFRGLYVRVEQSTQGHLVSEVYDGWSAPEWEVWQKDPDGHWTALATSYGEFAHFYTGKVVATLSGSENHSMRCRFTLANSQSDLLQGGKGECQVSDGGRIDLEF
jgi:hypothetical protein